MRAAKRPRVGNFNGRPSVVNLDVVRGVLGAVPGMSYNITELARGGYVDAAPGSAVTIGDCNGTLLVRAGARVNVLRYGPAGKLVNADADATLADEAAGRPPETVEIDEPDDVRDFRYFTVLGNSVFVDGEAVGNRGPFAAVQGHDRGGWCVLACALDEGGNDHATMAAPVDEHGLQFWRHENCSVYVFGSVPYYGECEYLNVCGDSRWQRFAGPGVMVHVNGRVYRNGEPAVSMGPPISTELLEDEVADVYGGSGSPGSPGDVSGSNIDENFIDDLFAAANDITDVD
jgi:hypothetical protein